jgi:hypothetical protein
MDLVTRKIRQSARRERMLAGCKRTAAQLATWDAAFTPSRRSLEGSTRSRRRICGPRSAKADDALPAPRLRAAVRAAGAVYLAKAAQAARLVATGNDDPASASSPPPASSLRTSCRQASAHVVSGAESVMQSDFVLAARHPEARGGTRRASKET